MTCQELECYLENPLRVEIYFHRESLPPAVSEHLAACEECARLFEEQKALGLGLRVARDAAPEVPAALSTRVLEGYRAQLASPSGFGRRDAGKFSNTWLRWGIAAAAAAAVIAIALFLSHNRAPIMVKTIAPPQMQAPPTAQREATVSPKPPVATEASMKGAPEPVRKRTAVASRGPLPPGFASLMYCDEMTCTGSLEVIRVELPPPAGQAQDPEAAPVMAEVLVGADGIARGIRIIQ